jgi:hypothetical protein
MKNSPGRNLKAIIGAIISVLFILYASFSCSNKGKMGLIPEKTFTSILSDVYLTDGLLSMSAIRDKYSRKDSINTYIDIIKNYGYTYDQMEKTLNYYFVNDPKQLVRIYDKIDEKLSEIEFKISTEQENALAAMTARMKKNSKFSLPDPELKEKPGFSYDIYPPGIFTLEFSVTIYPDDRSVNPSCIAWYSVSDGPDAGHAIYFPAIKYIRDGLPHVYTLRGRVEGNKKSVLKGLYFDYENNLEYGTLHAEIINLSFSYTGDLQ